MQSQSDAQQGIFYGIAAYIMWGLAPLYFKQLSSVAALEILSHRIVWSVVLLLGLVYGLKQIPQLIEGLKSPKRLCILFFASILLAINWLIYIWSVNNGHILEASLGYYINPLINVLLGAVVLGERLRPLQYVAVALVIIGVAILLLGFGAFPWEAISLAFTFSIYGLLRKMVSIGPIPGLAIETIFMLPMAGFYLFFYGSNESDLLHNTFVHDLLIIGLGVLTTAPLLCFIAAAKRLMYSTIGFLQYIGPSIIFVIAVTVYEEAFDTQRMVIFGFVWAGVVLFSLDSLRHYRVAKRQRLASQ